MPIKEAERLSGGAYCDLRELAGESTSDDGTLVLFRIVDWEDEDNPASKGEYGWNMPLIYDALAIHQDEDGEVTGHTIWLRQSMKFGSNPMWVLRGHSRPEAKLKRSELPKPNHEEYATGEVVEILGRVKRAGRGDKSYVVLNKPSAAEKKLANKVRDELGGDDWGHDGDDPF